MKKFMITGFSGFVSRHFLEYLEENEISASIKGLDIHNPEFDGDSFKFIQYDFEKVDLLHKDRVENIIFEFQPDYIIHLASFSSVAFSWKEPILSFQNNTNIYLNLLEAVRKLNLSTRILSVGSSEEYGDVKETDLPLTEDHPLKPVSPYAVARVSQELLSQIYADGYGLDIIMTRSFNHIGPFQKDIFVVSSFVKQLLEISNKDEKKDDLITGDINIVRDFTDVRDVVSAYYLLLNKGKNGEIYNVCSGVGISLENIIKIIGKYLGIEVTIKVDPKRIRPRDNKLIVGSNKKLKDLGWNQKYLLEDTLKDLIDYWKFMAPPIVKS
ncbi:MAG TPA: GDP-mannose 4,6-dehydratase [Desulfosporosinus sp.]|nr:GDP-mannose 4,6-dehydratase [Desulfosporosinus sp.]HUU41520.1 GDP-mannose 4,6-dehydratase [Desulfatiglandales bacterium]